MGYIFHWVLFSYDWSNPPFLYPKLVGLEVWLHEKKISNRWREFWLSLFSSTKRSSYQVRLVRRDNGAKIDVPMAGLAEKVQEILTSIQENLYNTAKEKRDACIEVVHTWDEFMTALNNKKMILAPWCDEEVYTSLPLYALFPYFLTFIHACNTCTNLKWRSIYGNQIIKWYSANLACVVGTGYL